MGVRHRRADSAAPPVRAARLGETRTRAARGAPADLKHLNVERDEQRGHERGDDVEEDNELELERPLARRVRAVGGGA